MLDFFAMAASDQALDDMLHVDPISEPFLRLCGK